MNLLDRVTLQWHKRLVIAIVVVLVFGTSALIYYQRTWNEDNINTGFDKTGTVYPWKSYPYSSRGIRFPDDEGVHGTTKEWWYINGHLTDGQNNRYGYMVSFFNNGLFIFTLSDDTNGIYYNSSTIFSYYSMSSGHLNLRFGDNRFYQIHGKPFDYILDVRMNNIKLYLLLYSEKPPLVEGIIPLENGYTYYYSQTQLGTTGYLFLEGNNITVSGNSWIDRQWGDWGLTGGWEWFSIKLDIGLDIMAYKIFNKNTGYPDIQLIYMMDAKNNIYSYNWSSTYNFKVEYYTYWKSHISGNLYSSAWDIYIPSRNITLHITPFSKDQEVNYLGTGLPEKYMSRAHFWEGECRVSGSVGSLPVDGYAYVEITHNYGYIVGDLIISRSEIIHKYDDYYWMVIEVKNKEPAPINTVYVKIFNANPDVGGSTLGFYTASSTQTNVSIISGTIRIQCDPEDLIIYIDPDNVSAETNEGNNMKRFSPLLFP